MNGWILVGVALVLLLLGLGIGGTIYLQKKPNDAAFWNSTQLWIGSTGIAMYIVLVVIVIALFVYLPAVLAQANDMAQQLVHVVNEFIIAAKTLQNIATKVESSTSVIDAAKNAVSNVNWRDLVSQALRSGAQAATSLATR
jgi:cobalamin biosynthesis protein CobD/CbiB